MTDLIPEPHSNYVTRVCELTGLDTRSLRDQISQKARLSTSYATRLVEDPTIICVAGERGSGKTTVLAAAAAQLSADGHVVVPPVRPEYFSASGSLIPTVVAHLGTTVREDWSRGSRKSDAEFDARVTRAIDRTLRQANLISYGNAPDSSALRADEQAADRSLAASADSDFLDNWRALTTQVREMAAQRSKKSIHPVIVIPVDDPDLAPGTLRQILLDLRLITSVDGVVGITCLDLDEARSVLTDAYTSSYRSSPKRLLTARVVEAQIAKAFPDDRRVEIAGLDADHRLSFRALDLPLPSIEKLCSVPMVSKGYGRDTVASVLRMPQTKIPSPYAKALPANPRDLRALAYRLSTIGDEGGSRASAAAMELCRTVIETGFKQSGVTDDHELWPAGMPFEVLDQSVDDRPSCALRLDEISVRAEKRTERRMPGSKDEDGTIAVSVSFDSGVDAHQVRRGRKAETIQRLDPSLAYAMLLVREFEHYHGLIHVNLSGSVPIRGGEGGTSFLAVRLDGQVTDNKFLTAPAWEAYYDYFLLEEALHQVIGPATTPHHLPDRRLAIEAYFIDVCRNIVSVQMSRRVAKDPARVSNRLRSARSDSAHGLLKRELKRLFDQIDKCLDAKRAGVTGPEGVRAQDFQLWVEVALVNICHDRLLTPEFSRDLLAHRERVLESRGRLHGANNELCLALENRVKSALDERWVGSLIDLIALYDENVAAMLMTAHRRALEAVERSRMRLLAESAMAPQAEMEQGSNDDFEIALEVLEQIEGETRSAMLRSGR